MSIEAMRQALEVLEQINKLSIGENAISLPGEIDAAMDNLRAAIEQAGEPYIAVNNDRITIDPVTGNVSIGIPAAPRQEPYDQTALELCEECGWKALIPGEGCLVCARQKAVAWMYDFLSDNEVIRDWMTQEYAEIEREKGFNVRPLYTVPREWIGLTTQEIEDEWERLTGHNIFGGDRSDGRTMFLSPDEVIHYTQAIEAKLKEKNYAG